MIIYRQSQYSKIDDWIERQKGLLKDPEYWASQGSYGMSDRERKVRKKHGLEPKTFWKKENNRED